ncbi:MAG TPA: hypothetical protein DG753_10455 [Clostridium sp.]|nr:hypothetical protein [Clostridium sp.]
MHEIIFDILSDKELQVLKHWIKNSAGNKLQRHFLINLLVVSKFIIFSSLEKGNVHMTEQNVNKDRRECYE